MDGTLGPSRKPVLNDMIPVIANLLKYSRVGIVSGSGFDYINEQCAHMWNDDSIDASLIDIMPCNGTQRLVWDHNSSLYTSVYNKSMKEEMGELGFKKLIRSILEAQSRLANVELDLPISGTFIQYRGSMVNWCMSGRNHSDLDRELFLKLDNDKMIRKTLLTKLRRKLAREKVKNVTMALGGECSIDIYPTGWDKTHALQHYPNMKAFFVGDKCKEGGNDFAIYDMLSQSGTSYETTGPEMTKKIINNNIIPQLKEDNK